MTTRIGFKFEGGLADSHSIDASDGATFHEAARQLLALHAYFLTSGDIPNGGVFNHTRNYRVFECASKEGSIEFFYSVEVFSNAVLATAGGVIGARCGALIYEELLEQSIRQLITKVPELFGYWKTEDVLRNSDGNREPLVDLESEAISRWQRLQARCIRPLLGCLRPIGRSANVLTIHVGDTGTVRLGFDEFTRLTVKFHDLRDQEITVAVHAVRDSKTSTKNLF